MKTLTKTTTFSATLLLAASALAEPVMDPVPAVGPSTYVFGYGGLNWQDDVNANLDGANLSLATDDGWTAGGGLGLMSDFLGGSRLELETFYSQNDANNLAISGLGSLDLPGDLSITSVQVNFIKELFDLGFLQPYAGIGVGFASVEADLAGIVAEETAFAWQAIAGVDFNLSERVALFLQYRFLMVPELDDGFDELNGSSALGGIRIRF